MQLRQVALPVRRLTFGQPQDHGVESGLRRLEVLDRAIGDHGGEILKFVGDGVLAIFDAERDGEAACRKALAAAKVGLAGMAEENTRRIVAGLPEIRCGIGLHFGDVQFGNIGARDRLDFTAIGPAINEACRLEALCKVLERPLVASAAFARQLAGVPLVSLGFHAFRGISEPQEVFGVAAK